MSAAAAATQEGGLVSNDFKGEKENEDYMLICSLF